MRQSKLLFMKTLERPRLTREFLEKRRPSDSASSIKEIDVNKYKQLGVNTLFLDVEGTIVEHNGWKIDQEVVDKVSEFRQAGFNKVVIITNKKPNDEFTFVKINSWAQQIGADLVFTPESKQERTPHPDILLKAAVALGIEPKQALMVGDKVTGGIMAANAAGMYSVLVERRGEKDTLGNKYVRRPYEEKLMEGMGDTEGPFQLNTPPSYVINDLPQKMELPAWTEDIDPELLTKSKIVNFGRYRAASIAVVGGVTLPFQDARKAIKDHYYEHGRAHADTATRVRRVAGYGVGALIILDEIEWARYGTIGAKLLDVYDGPSARAHKNGATAKGAVDDRQADRENSRATVVPAVATGRLKKRHLVAREASEKAMERVRAHYKARGVDVRARGPGKWAAAVEDIAEVSMLSDKNPEWIQYTADAVKIGRVPVYAVLWEMEARKRERELPLFEAAKAELLADGA